MQESETLSSHLKHLVERLLQQDIPDQCGTSGKLRYNLTNIKITKVKLPSATLTEGAVIIQHGEVFITGKYDFLYQSFFSHACSGQFDIHIGDLCVILRESHRQRRHQHQNLPPSRRHLSSTSSNQSHHKEAADHHTIVGYVRYGDIKCMVGYIKCKFIGGSARMCSVFAKIFARMWRTDIEESMAEFIKSMFMEEEEMNVIAILGLLTFNSDEDRVVRRPEQTYSRRLRNYLRHR